MRKVEKVTDLARFTGNGSRVVDGDGIDVALPKPKPKPVEPPAPPPKPEPDRLSPAFEGFARTVAALLVQQGEAASDRMTQAIAALGQQKPATPVVVAPAVHGWEVTPHRDSQGRIERITVIPLKK